jgi:DNA helicase-2/ATP-dependent DNA helicase PcrA
MTELMKLKPLKDVFSLSYNGIFVDEYQDCSLTQHNFIMELSQIAPIRIFGDPLQAIFSFKKEHNVDFDKHVLPFFNKLELNVPHRWTEYNQNLGKWLSKIRPKLQTEKQLNSYDCPNDSVIWHEENEFIKKLKIINDITNNNSDDEIVVIYPDPKKGLASVEEFVKRLPRYILFEAHDNKNLLDYARKFDSLKNFDLCIAVCKFIKNTLNNISPISVLLKRFEQEKFPASKKEEISALSKCFREAMGCFEQSCKHSLIKLLNGIKIILGGRIWRRDLFTPMLSAIQKAIEDNSSIEEALIKIREMNRIIGRKIPKKCITNNLLCKGLEFDYVIILDAHNIEKKEYLYVALSRARKKVIIIAKQNYWKEKEV